ncbi:MAG: type VI secretion system tip protein TssI/VgrG [Pyrinomonadaceae bacterium]
MAIKTTQNERLIQLSTPLEKDFLMIERLRGTEGLSQLFHFDLELLHEEQFEGFEPTAVDPQKLLGNPMTISAHQPGPTTRYFNGICIRFSQGGRDARFSSYRVELVPKVWVLTQISRSRIFQNKTVSEILDEVLEGFEVSNEIDTQGMKPRNYCVQYRESDWDFISRLMEEEGIYYYFEHTKEKHKLILGNTPSSHRVTPTAAKITFALERSELTDQWIPAIYKWRTDDRMFSGKVELRDYHFQLPTNNLQAIQTSRFDIGKNQDLEVYDWPGGYAKRFDGIDPGGDENSSLLDPIFEDRERTVKIRQEELDAKYKQAVAVSNCCAITAGYRFSLIDHPTKKNNIDYIVFAAEHEAYQSPTYISDDVVEAPYSVHFTCMPHGGGHAPFRPERKTPKPIVHGSQTAVVVGNPADEIFVDKYGRVKVHFHWDRSDHNDQRASAWIRVGQLLAGNKWGAAFWPRVGQEVIVDFLEGDPDQPIIVGSTYNEKNLPHYELDKYKTLSYIKTHSTPKAKGFNELRFEDKAKKEQVFIHSQKRYDLRARGSMYETCGGNRQEVIGWSVQDGDEEDHGGNLAITVGGNYDLHVNGDRFIGLDQKLYEGVKSDVAEEYKGKLQTVVTAKTELNAREITLEAFSKITLRVGASCVILDLSGVQIQGPMVKVNCGAVAAPTAPMQMGDPLDAEHADTGEPGYLDRPRTGGGGGGRRWRTVNGQHAPIVRDDAFALTRAGGSGDDLDRALVAAELSKLPPHIIQRMSDNGTTVVVGRGSITDIDPSLRGVQPRGWPAGSTWDTVPGLYNPSNNQVQIATRGHGTENGPYVPPTGDGHGSSNLVIHEGMHSVDHNGPGGSNISSTDPNFTNARNNDPAIMADGYEGTANPAGAEEAYAESAARYYGGDPNDATNHPGVHNYWAGDPLNPTPPAPAGP